MKTSILKYGGYGFLTGAIVFLLALTLGKNLDFSTQEIIGYLTIFVSLSFVYFGIKHYRNEINNGSVSFVKALIIGVLISTIVGLGIAIVDYLYTSVINPDFRTEFFAKSVENLESNFTGAELETKKEELKAQMELYSGSYFMAFIMFVTVFLIGFIISLISALVLQKK
ncbi:MAG: DUF4199 domain-containing protein [Bacteroidota bacterium]